MKKTESFLRKRRFLTVIPVLVYPFLCLIFWGLGGGQATANIVKEDTKKGLNPYLPDAKITDNNTDMLSLYDRAARDSAKLSELRKIEARNFGMETLSSQALSGSTGVSSVNNYSIQNTETKVNDRLAALQKSLDQASTPVRKDGPEMQSQSNNEGNLRRMQSLLSQAENPTDKPEDPEIRTLNGMLDKILEIQNPGRTTDKAKELSTVEKGRVFTISDAPKRTSLYMDRRIQDTLSSKRKKTQFFSAKAYNTNENAERNTVKAMVYEGGKFTTNSRIMLMLEEDVYISGTRIPKGTSVSGICEVSNERLKIRIENIGYNGSFYRVKLSVFDSDAQEGVSAPGAITRDQVKDGASNAIQSLNIGGYDPSIGAQAANAGIETAKNIMSKKTKIVYAIVNTGHHVLLVDDKVNQ